MEMSTSCMFPLSKELEINGDDVVEVDCAIVATEEYEFLLTALSLVFLMFSLVMVKF